MKVTRHSIDNQNLCVLCACEQACTYMLFLSCIIYLIGPAQFERCSGDNIPQVGCSGMKELSSTAGESVAFNVALTHQQAIDNCFNQGIQMVSFLKNGSPFVMCSSITCEIHDPRVNVVRSVDRFNITIVLHNLTTSDSGAYVAIADIRRPSNNMRVDTFKNFSLNVVDHIGTLISHAHTCLITINS